MKLSELKQIIRECVDELYESGPADRHRRETGISYKTTGRDELESRVKNSKRSEHGLNGSGRLAKKPLKTMIQKSIERKKNKSNDGSVVHLKKAKGGSKESASKRQWNIDHGGQYPKVTKRGKLPK